jgi:hypothetical protein
MQAPGVRPIQAAPLARPAPPQIRPQPALRPAPQVQARPVAGPLPPTLAPAGPAAPNNPTANLGALNAAKVIQNRKNATEKAIDEQSQ